MSTDNTSKLKTGVQEQSDFTFKHLKMAKDGTVTGAEDLYPKFVEQHGKTMEEVNAIHEMDAVFVAGTVHGLGRHTHHVFEKHPSVADINITVPMAMGGRNKIQAAFEREHTYATPGRDGKPAGTVTQYNVSTVKVHTVEANFSAGQLKAVRQDLNEQARAAFGEKAKA